MISSVFFCFYSILVTSSDFKFDFAVFYGLSWYFIVLIFCAVCRLKFAYERHHAEEATVSLPEKICRFIPSKHVFE